MIFRLAGGAEDAQAGSIGPRQQVGADGAGGSGAQAGDGDVIRQLRAGDLADDDAFQFPFSGVVEHDDRMIEARIDLLAGHRFDPFAMGHQAGGFGRRHAALVHAHAHAGGKVNAPARRVELRALTPLAKAQAHGFDRFVHGDNAANLLGTDEDGLHERLLEIMECWK